jgi:hypothetical protein
MTKHQEDDAYVVDIVLRNLPEIPPFVVRWKFPLMVPDDDLDPAKLKKAQGRPSQYNATDLFNILPADGSGLTNKQFMKKAQEEEGIKDKTYYTLRKELVRTGKVLQSKTNKKWQRILK